MVKVWMKRIFQLFSYGYVIGLGVGPSPLLHGLQPNLNENENKGSRYHIFLRELLTILPLPRGGREVEQMKEEAPIAVVSLNQDKSLPFPDGQWEGIFC